MILEMQRLVNKHPGALEEWEQRFANGDNDQRSQSMLVRH